MSNNPVNLCKLCKERPAIKPGAHIFSHALVSKCTNEEGQTGRDKEIMFTISQSGDMDMYVGRLANLDKVEELKGRPLTDEELAANNNGLVKDYDFCVNCEHLFSKIETAFAKTLTDIRTKAIKPIKANLELRLYFIIQTWRASAVGQDKWSLSEPFEEKLRNIVYKGCSQYKSGISSEITEDILSIPMIVTFLETSTLNSSNIVLITDNVDPYLLFLCDFILQIYEPKRDISDPAPFSVLNTKKEHKPINIQEKEFILGFMSDSDRQILVESVHDVIAAPALNKIIEKFKAYCLNYGVIANETMIELFVTTLIKEEPIPIAERYSEERIKYLAKKLTGS